MQKNCYEKLKDLQLENETDVILPGKHYNSENPEIGAFNSLTKTTSTDVLYIEINESLKPATILKKLNDIDLKNKVVELFGKCITELSISERKRICKLLKEKGTSATICQFDHKLLEYLQEKTKEKIRPVFPDPAANYVKSIVL